MLLLKSVEKSLEVIVLLVLELVMFNSENLIVLFGEVALASAIVNKLDGVGS